MIKLEDLDEAIAECQGERDPNANTCIKLAAFYIIKERLYGAESSQSVGSINNVDSINIDKLNSQNYSYDTGYDSDTDFARLANRASYETVMSVIDELMTVLEATNPRLYRGVLQKIEKGT